MLTGLATPRWVLHPAADATRAAALAHALDAPPVVGQLLLNRGIGSPTEASGFLTPAWEHLHDPSLMLGMDAAVDRIIAAIRAGEGILVHGDYDVDGVTSTFMLVAALRALGGKVEHRIPHRTHDGYGLSIAGVEAVAAAGVRLIVTVDCGITALAPVARARELGVDVVVTDHHEPGPELPIAASVINPHREGCPYPCKALAGVGVTFKLVQALLATDGKAEWAKRLLDVVALGTIADAVPLVGENRVLARLGLERLSRPHRPGVQALIEVAGLGGRPIGAGHVAFQLAPRINAAGRMGSAQQALRLLFARDAEEARACAQSLDEDNTRRRELDERAQQEAGERVEHELGWPECWSIVLWSEHWHPGVLGIVASRLVERFQRPTILVGIHNGRGRGSGRSVAGLDLTQLLTRCSDLLEAYGGHAYAAGLTIAKDRLPEFRSRVEAEVRSRLDPAAFAPRLTLDADLRLSECDTTLIEWLERLPPHGTDNSEPLFRAAEVAVDNITRVGDGKHLKFRAHDAWGTADAIGFGLGEQADALGEAGRCAMAFVPQRNDWQGQTRIQLKVRGLKIE